MKYRRCHQDETWFQTLSRYVWYSCIGFEESQKRILCPILLCAINFLLYEWYFQRRICRQMHIFVESFKRKNHQINYSMYLWRDNISHLCCVKRKYMPRVNIESITSFWKCGLHKSSLYAHLCVFAKLCTFEGQYRVFVFWQIFDHPYFLNN